MGKPDEAEIGTILHMLDVVFSDDVKLEEKKRVLEHEYGVQMNEDIDKGLSTMCNISQGIWEKGRVEGRVEGKAEGKRETEIELARAMYANKMPIDLIAKYVKCPIDVLRSMLEPKPKNA